MPIVAGIDIGNATTEIVVVEQTGEGVVPIAWDRAVTRGGKGSLASLAGAAGLVRRLCRRHDLRLDAARVARLHAVRTDVALVAAPVLATGRLEVVTDRADTAGGSGIGFGRPVSFAALDGICEDSVVLVPREIGFAAAAAGIAQAVVAGRPVRGVLLEADEAVLVANRLPRALPVVDSVDLAQLAGVERIGVEVAGIAGVVRQLGDALWVSSSFGLGPDERADAAAVCATLAGRSHAVLVTHAHAVAAPRSTQPKVGFADGQDLDLPDALDAIRTGRPGDIASFAGQPAHDLFAVDLAATARGVLAPDDRRPVALALLEHTVPNDPAEVLAEQLGVAVHGGWSEAAAARSGALTTPGAGKDTVVVDIGAGTTDVIDESGRAATAAGAGELVTIATAALLDTVRGAAEWIKRGPCALLERPQLMVGEDGGRSFLDVPAPPEAVGRLVVTGPAGPLPFGRGLSTAEWRIVRQALKREIVGVNLGRCLRALDVVPGSVVVVGGPAGDDEALTAVMQALPGRPAVGRGDVAGRLGHRYAAAYGLAAVRG